MRKDLEADRRTRRSGGLEPLEERDRIGVACGQRLRVHAGLTVGVVDRARMEQLAVRDHSGVAAQQANEVGGARARLTEDDVVHGQACAASLLAATGAAPAEQMPS